MNIQLRPISLLISSACVLVILLACSARVSPGFDHAAKNQPRPDAQGDPLPSVAVARLGTIRFRHGGRVGALAYSPDGQLFASGGPGGPRALWEPASGKRPKQFSRHPQAPGGLCAFFPVVKP